MSLSLRVTPGPFGAEITGLDPAGHAADASARDFMRAALTTHGVLCVRFAAPLDDVEARALASMIGPIKDPIGQARDGTMLRYGDDRQIIDSGFVLTKELRAELGDVSFGGDSLRPGLFEMFHTDDSYGLCCVDLDLAGRDRGVVRFRSDRSGEFGERVRDALMDASFDAEFVMATTQVLQERVTAHDHAPV